MEERIVNNLHRAVLLTTALLFAAPGWADSPPDMETTDSHSLAVTGKITRYRVQMEGLEIGRGTEKADAEILVTLDNDSNNVYVVRLHGDSPPVNTVMANALREAFINNIKVTLYHQKSPSDHLKIHLVQLER